MVQLASDSYLKEKKTPTPVNKKPTGNLSKGGGLSQKSSGTLKTIKSLKAQLARINDVQSDMTDN